MQSMFYWSGTIIASSSWCDHVACGKRGELKAGRLDEELAGAKLKHTWCPPRWWMAAAIVCANLEHRECVRDKEWEKDNGLDRSDQMEER